jgi:hypothetical protein
MGKHKVFLVWVTVVQTVKLVQAVAMALDGKTFVTLVKAVEMAQVQVVHAVTMALVEKMVEAVQSLQKSAVNR